MARPASGSPAPSPAPLPAAKAALRREIAARLGAMDSRRRAAASARMHARLFALPAFTDSGGVHCYISRETEPDTGPIFERCRELGIPTWAPYQIPAAGRLGWARWSPGEPLVKGPLAILEPPPPTSGSGDANAIDLVIVPGVAFDRAGGRLGHGKGYYDRFLAEWRTAQSGPNGTLSVGLAFHRQMVAAVPTASWDMTMDLVITDRDEIWMRTG